MPATKMELNPNKPACSPSRSGYIAKANYKNKADKRSAKLEAMIEGKIRVKTEEKRSLRKKEKAEKEAKK